MITLQLTDLYFFAYHGLHPEEAILGAEYKVELTIVLTTEDRIDSLEQTMDYVKAYAIIASFMNKRYNLLETLAMDITVALHESEQKIKKINISILKMNVPLSNFKGNVAVAFCKEY